MPIKHPQAKGKRFEYFVRDTLRRYGYKAERTPLSGAIQSWKGDITAHDFPFFIEAKNTETSTFVPWYKKAQDEAGAKPAIVIWTKNDEPAYCFFLFTDLLDILKGDQPVRTLYAKPKRFKKAGPEPDSTLRFSKLAQLHKRPIDNRYK